MWIQQYLVVEISYQIIYKYCTWSNVIIDHNIDDFLSNFLSIKFDFGFMDSFLSHRKILHWVAESEKMENLKFYCQSTIQNYFILIIIIFFILVWYIAYEKLKVISKLKECFVLFKEIFSKVV